MKYLMIAFAIASWGFAAWTSQHLVSDIQFMLMMLGVFFGGAFIGMSAILASVER